MKLYLRKIPVVIPCQESSFGVCYEVFSFSFPCFPMADLIVVVIFLAFVSYTS